MLDFSLSLDEILFAVVLGLILTWIIQNLKRLKGFLNDASLDFNNNAEDISRIMQKCYAMFPVEKVLFKGETFMRGMQVRVTTMQKKSFEGELIGTNHKNMICIITNRYIIAHEINNIDTICVCSHK